MNQHIRLAHIVGQLRRVGQSVEEIGLKAIEAFDAQRDMDVASVLGDGGVSRARALSVPIVFRR